nr:hypothetical protein [Tanacetum cinerariifolium]
MSKQLILRNMHIKVHSMKSEAIHLILTGIGDEIYSIVDAYTTAKEMWTTIERLQQSESLNKQDVKTNFFWEFVPNEVNEIHAKKLAKNANPLALVTTAQHYPEYHNQALKPHKYIAYSSKQTTTSKSHASTRHKCKKIDKLVTPPSESASDEDSDLEHARRDKQLQKDLALVANYIKNICSKPTNNNLKTSSNTRNKNINTTLRSKNDINTRQFVNQRTMSAVGAIETIGNQAEKGVPLSAEQEDWLDDTDEDLDEQELEAYYILMAKIQEVPSAESGPTYDVEPIEKVHTDNEVNVFANDQEHTDQPINMNDTPLMETLDSNTTLDSSDVCNNDFEDDQNADNQEDRRVALANLIANLKLDTDENKKIQKQLKRVNASLTHELNKCKSALAESNDIRDRCRKKIKESERLKIELSKQKDNVCKEIYIELLRSFAILEKHSISLEIALHDYLKAQLQDRDVAITELKKLIEKSKGKSVETKFDKPPVIRQTNAIKVLKPSVLGKPTPFSDSLEKRNFSKPRSVTKTNVNKGLSKPVTPQMVLQTQTRTQVETNKNVINPGMYRLDTMPTQPLMSQLP